MKKKVKGAHYTIDFFGCDVEQLNSLEFWEKILPEAAEVGGLDVLYSYMHPFDPQGITGFLLLSSSHISFHTWPEYNYVACDVFSCTSGEETKRSVDYIKSKLKHTRSKIHHIKRGYVIMDYFISPVYATDKKEYIKVDKKVAEIKSPFQKIVVIDTAKYGRCMAIDGLIQTSERDHIIYDKAILSKHKKSDKKILILGGGDGYVAEEINRKNPDCQITIVDLDQAVVDVSKKYFSQSVFSKKNVHINIGDAMHFTSLCAAENLDRYDGVVIDLTDNPIGSKNGKRDLERFYKKLFPQVSAILNKRGWVSIQVGASKVKSRKYIDSLAIIEPLFSEFFDLIEHKSILIPSFSEKNSFLFGKRVDKK